MGPSGLEGKVVDLFTVVKEVLDGLEILQQEPVEPVGMAEPVDKLPNIMVESGVLVEVEDLLIQILTVVPT